MAQPKFLVIGASGLLGQRFLKVLGPENAVGTYRDHKFDGGIPFDVTVPRFIEDRLPFKPTHLLMLACKTGIDFCARNPDVTARINVDGIKNVLGYALEHEIIPIFTSSDAVYPDRPHGRSAPDENVLPSPATTYGKQKLEIETFIRASFTEYLILRLSKLLDADLHPAGLLGPWLNNFFEGTDCDVLIDRFFNPIDVRDVVNALDDLARMRFSGILNLGGLESLSYCDLAVMLARRCIDLGVPYHPRIVSMSLRFSTGFAEPRSPDSTIRTYRQRILGLLPRELTDTCDDAVRNFVKAHHPGAAVA